VYDKKQIRRRRAVLGVLVGASLILLTAYFGESPSSPLHQVQRGIVEVLSPVQEGASKVLSPVRDVAGWFSDTFKAKSRVDRLNRRVRSLTAQLATLKGEQLQNQQLRREVGLDNATGIAAYAPVAAEVYSRDPQLWYATISVGKGTSDGVRVNDPVIGGGGLVGKVTTADPTVSVVTLITDHSSSVTATVQDAKGDTGELVPAVGNPNQLLLTYLDPHAQISVGEMVVTAGFKSGQFDSLYPPNIPIGVVSSADQNQLVNNQQVQVDPIVDLRRLTSVQILTRPGGTAQRAGLGGVTQTAQVGGG
jgi:rod shape-determining protein MreC